MILTHLSKYLLLFLSSLLIISMPIYGDEAHISQKVYISLEKNKVLLFNSDHSGIQYSNNQSDFSWSWDSSNDKPVNIGTKSYFFEVSPRVAIYDDETFYQPQALSLNSVNGKIIAINTDNDAYCSARTIKFTEATATINEVCTTGFHIQAMVLTKNIDFNQGLKFNYTRYDGVARELLVFLANGTIDSGTLIFVHKNDGVLDFVEKDSIYTTDEEASPSYNTSNVNITPVLKLLFDD